MNDRHNRTKYYAIAVIKELQLRGYTEDDAKTVFLRYYRIMKRSGGLNMNPSDFAKEIDEIERSVRDQKPEDPYRTYMNYIRQQTRKQYKEKPALSFNITKGMEQRIIKWDSCIAADVTGAKFAYTFIPTGLGLVIRVKCDVCNRELELSDW